MGASQNLANVGADVGADGLAVNHHSVRNVWVRRFANDAETISFEP
jgi:hypothetical protein